MSIPTTSTVPNRKRPSTTSRLWHEAVHRSRLRGLLVLTLNSALELGPARKLLVPAAPGSPTSSPNRFHPLADRGVGLPREDIGDSPVAKVFDDGIWPTSPYAFLSDFRLWHSSDD